MNAAPQTSPRRPFLGLALAGLLLTSSFCLHVLWTRGEGDGVHGLVALFAGGLLLLVLATLWTVVATGWRQGWRGGFRWATLVRLCWILALALSWIALFYTVELWRGKRAWARMLVRAQELGQTPGQSLSSPVPVPDDANAARAPVFAPLDDWTRNERGHWVVRDTPASRRLQDFGSWEGRFLTEALGAALRMPWLRQEETDLRRWHALYLDPTNRSFCVYLDQAPASVRASGPSSPGSADPAERYQLPPALALRYGLRSRPSTPEDQAQLERLRAASREESAAAILAAQEPWRPDLDALREASRHPHARFHPPEWSGDLLWLHRQVLSRISQVARVRASAELALGRNEAAFEDTRLALRLADYARRQPVILTHEAAYAAVLAALQPLWEGCSRRCWTAAQLEAFQQQLAEVRVLDDFPDVLRRDFQSQVELINQIVPVVAPPADHALLPLDPNDDATVTWVRRFYPRGWSWQMQAALYAYLYDVVLPTVDVSGGRVQPPKPGTNPLITATSDPFFPVFIVPKAHEIFAQSLYYFPLTQTALHLATVGCALERYRLRNGRYPDALNALSPEILSRIPTEITRAAPLVYRLSPPDGFVLYSIGWDGRDDQGRPPQSEAAPGIFHSLRQGDWVWRR